MASPLTLPDAPFVPGATAPTTRPAVAAPVRGALVAPWPTVSVLAALLLWCYWPTLATMAERWSTEPQYSHGFLVPIFALAVFVLRRSAALPAWAPSWWGVPVLLGAIVLRFVAAELDNQFLDGLSLLGMLVGVVLLVGGWPILRWAWPAIAFLGFMLPLPFVIEVALSHPLQRVATNITTFVLQTLGYPALAEGNIIVLEQMRLGVVEACSGLGMLMTFFALSTAMALVMRSPWPDRLVIVASAVPIAVIVNVIRITATGMAYYHLGQDSTVAKAIMHDMAGWLMMPLALLLLWLELKYLNWLLQPIQPRELKLTLS